MLQLLSSFGTLAILAILKCNPWTIGISALVVFVIMYPKVRRSAKKLWKRMWDEIIQDEPEWHAKGTHR
jgi:hypothetical protein